MSIDGKSLLLAIGVLIFALSCSGASLTVATYNVENYTAADRMVEGVFRRNYPKPEAAKAALRTAIRELAADILFLQEMGVQGYLEELQRDLRAEGSPYSFATVLEAADSDRHLAVLSRYPVVATRKHTDLVISYFGSKEPVKRGLLEVEVELAGRPVSAFVVHLKSRHTDRADDPESAVRRAAEATAVRDRILERFPQPEDARFLVLGDFNDAKSSRPIRAFLSRGKLALSTLLPAFDSRGETWTYRYAKDDSYSRVDHILVSPGLRHMVKTGRAVILDSAAVGLASDHRPVKVTLEEP